MMPIGLSLDKTIFLHDFWVALEVIEIKIATCLAKCGVWVLLVD